LFHESNRSGIFVGLARFPFTDFNRHVTCKQSAKREGEGGKEEEEINFYFPLSSRASVFLSVCVYPYRTVQKEADRNKREKIG
jgi:hypothetical protein